MEKYNRLGEEKSPYLLQHKDNPIHWFPWGDDVAQVLNKDFISIKVDREERPDVDAIYMSAVQAMTGGGGWPMTVWLTPGRRLFFHLGLGGTEQDSWA